MLGNRATSSQIMDYKFALFNCSTVQLFNCSTVQLFNCSTVQLFNSWRKKYLMMNTYKRIGCNSILSKLSDFQTFSNPNLKLNIYSAANYKTGKNSAINRSPHITNKLELLWLNLSSENFILKCKNIFLNRAL